VERPGGLASPYCGVLWRTVFDDAPAAASLAQTVCPTLLVPIWKVKYAARLSLLHLFVVSWNYLYQLIPINLGSRFSFTARVGIGDAAALSPPLPSNALQQMRVMVVDDCASARTALVDMLDGFGIKADAVASGEASLARLAQAVDEGHPYQVVLMDYVMPGWDGVEIIRQIRADRRSPACSWRIRARGWRRC
jgi:hypothetical protein